MNRDSMLTRLGARKKWDLIIIGGGASGLGCAVDAASRGLSTLLLEQADFAQGTSSRSTKLVHGGVRYLKQGDIGLVREALRERGRMYRNAPHLVRDLQFVVPRYSWWEGPFYGIGLKLYDMLAGKLNFGKSRGLDPKETLALIPNLEDDELLGGVMYHDGQFDDSRMALALAFTAADHGACMLNHAGVTSLVKGSDGLLAGVRFVDHMSGDEHEVMGSAIINATGIFTDSIRQLDDTDAAAICRPSQGVHIVLPKRFLQGNTAIMVPHTDDGRILFAIPWHGRTLVGTTDYPQPGPLLEPKPTIDEVGFILRNANRYLEEDPVESDILSCFAGMRPLISKGGDAETKSISRKHEVLVSASGLITLAGGKWTTYRQMAQDAVDQAVDIGDLPENSCVTEGLHLHGWMQRDDPEMPVDNHLHYYGSDARRIADLVRLDPSLGETLHPELPYTAAQVVWAVREELACTVEDVLSRRTRALLLHAKASVEIAPQVASMMASEMGHDAAWEADQVAKYEALAKTYLPSGLPR